MPRPRRSLFNRVREAVRKRRRTPPPAPAAPSTAEEDAKVAAAAVARLARMAGQDARKAAGEWRARFAREAARMDALRDRAVADRAVMAADARAALEARMRAAEEALERAKDEVDAAAARALEQGDEWARRVEGTVLPQRDALLEMAECVRETMGTLEAYGREEEAAGSTSVADLAAGLAVAAASPRHRVPRADALPGLEAVPRAEADGLHTSVQLCFESYGYKRAEGSVLARDGWWVTHAERARLLTPAFAVQVRGDGGAVAVAVRGTHSLHDVLVDMSWLNSPLGEEYGLGSGELVHRGVATATARVREALEAPLAAALGAAAPGCELLVVGHSLGGGVASLLAERLARADERRRVRCHTFGSMATVTAGAAAAAEPRTTAVVLGGDPVPRFSLHNVIRLQRHVARQRSLAGNTRRRIGERLEQAWAGAVAERRAALERYAGAVGASARSADALLDAWGGGGGGGKEAAGVLAEAERIHAALAAKVAEIEADAVRASEERRGRGGWLRSLFGGGAGEGEVEEAGEAEDVAEPALFPAGRVLFLDEAQNPPGLYTAGREALLSDIAIGPDMFEQHRVVRYARALGALRE